MLYRDTFGFGLLLFVHRYIALPNSASTREEDFVNDMEPMLSRVAHTPLGHTIDVMENGHYWVCDQNHNCREISGLWEAEEFIRERETGIRHL